MNVFEFCYPERERLQFLLIFQCFLFCVAFYLIEPFRELTNPGRYYAFHRYVVVDPCESCPECAVAWSESLIDAVYPASEGVTKSQGYGTLVR